MQTAVLLAGEEQPQGQAVAEAAFQAFEQGVLQALAASKGTTPEEITKEPTKRMEPPGARPRKEPWWTPACSVSHEKWKQAQYRKESHDTIAKLKRNFRATRDAAKRSFGWHLERFRCDANTAQQFWSQLRAHQPPLAPTLEAFDEHFRLLHSCSEEAAEELPPALAA